MVFFFTSAPFFSQLLLIFVDHLLTPHLAGSKMFKTEHSIAGTIFCPLGVTVLLVPQPKILLGLFY